MVSRGSDFFLAPLFWNYFLVVLSCELARGRDGRLEPLVGILEVGEQVTVGLWQALMEDDR